MKFSERAIPFTRRSSKLAVMPNPPNRPFYPHGKPPSDDASSDGSRGGGFGGGGFGGGSRGGFRTGRAAPRGNTSREGSWKRSEGEPRGRSMALRLAAARADLERMIRELEDASKALTAPGVKMPPTSVLEHTKELDLDSIFAPWRRVRAALADVERACVQIERLKFPPKPFAPSEFRPKLG